MSINEEKTGTGELRHDTTPLTKRFPQLIDMTAASWMSGTLGNKEVPGPTTYWIDAVVSLKQADYDALLSTTNVTASSDSLALIPKLAPEVPQGALLSSPALNEQFSQSEFSTKAYLVADTTTLILMSVFQ